MTPTYFCYESHVFISAEEIYAWHKRRGAFERLLPPWQRLRVIRYKGSIEEGDELMCDLWLGPLKRRCLFRHGVHVEGRSFSTHQVQGPFDYWEHRHLFIPQGLNECFLKDEIYYIMPEYSPTSCIASYNIIPFLKKLFSYRHRVIAGDCNWHQRYSKNKPLKIAITDDSGALSSILMSFLSSGGHKILPLSRVPKKGALLWNPDTGELDTNRLESFDAIINLTGESLTSGRWNKAKKAHILQNRVIATKTLCNALLKMKSPPKTFLNASSLGLYGDRGNELITEQSAPGKTFLSEVSLQWEEPLSTLKNKGIRTIALRFGSILTPNHGLLKKMLWAFKHCLGGRIGSGDQYMSWIAIDDVLGAILHILATTSMEGAINLSAPTSITNAEFTETLGTILHRPTLIPLPATISRLFFGEMADALLLNSCRAVPLELEKSGYEFLYPNLRDALNHLL